MSSSKQTVNQQIGYLTTRISWSSNFIPFGGDRLKQGCGKRSPGEEIIETVKTYKIVMLEPKRGYGSKQGVCVEQPGEMKSET